jgi:hypothetical protein
MPVSHKLTWAKLRQQPFDAVLKALLTQNSALTASIEDIAQENAAYPDLALSRGFESLVPLSGTHQLNTFLSLTEKL